MIFYLLNRRGEAIEKLKQFIIAKADRLFGRGALAQLARAPALQAGGPGFESPMLHQKMFSMV